MGILNITPNSFSGDGKILDAQTALTIAKKMIKDGANIIDIGAESTAPNAEKISSQEEWQRLKNILPVLLKEKLLISLDSYKASTWKKFLQLGGRILNDVSGLQIDQEQKIQLLQKFPKSQVVIMFSRDISLPDPRDIIKEIKIFFTEQLDLLEKNGIEKERVILDPGMGGFLSKNPDISFEVLQKLEHLKKFNCPLLVGTSRKSFLRKVSHPSDPKKRVIASVTSAIMAIQNGANIIRVHDIPQTKEAIETLSM